MMISATTGATRAETENVPVLRGRDIVCFSHDWTGDPLSRTHLMLAAVHGIIGFCGSTQSASVRLLSPPAPT